MAKAGGTGTVLADATVLIAVVPGLGPCAREMDFGVSVVDFFCQVRPSKWSVSDR